MAKRQPFLVEDAGECTDCFERPARIAVPGPGGSTWLFCISCAHQWVDGQMRDLIEKLESEPRPSGLPEPPPSATVGPVNGGVAEA